MAMTIDVERHGGNPPVTVVALAGELDASNYEQVIDVVRNAYAEEQKMVPIMIDDPSVGLYSPTDATKGPALTQKFADGIGEIVTGAQPLSAYDQRVKDGRAAGGDQRRTEYEQLYAASKA